MEQSIADAAVQEAKVLRLSDAGNLSSPAAAAWRQPVAPMLGLSNGGPLQISLSSIVFERFMDFVLAPYTVVLIQILSKVRKANSWRPPLG